MSSSKAEPIYILGRSFTSGMVVRFDVPSHSARLDKVDADKAEDVASVYVIPDDIESSAVTFDPEEPPNLDEYSIPYHQAKYVKKWSATLASTYLRKAPPQGNSRKPIPMWYPSGAAVLLQHSALKYTFVSELTYSFEMQPRDEVVEFRIAMHDKDTLEPRAWVRGRNNFYLLSEKKVLPVKATVDIDNPYKIVDPYPHDKYDEMIGELSDIKNVTDSKNYNTDEYIV